jgi:hypothetical protein
VSVFRQ